MIIKYPYITIGIFILVMPFLFFGGVLAGSMYFLMNSEYVDAEPARTYDDIIKNKNGTLVIYPQYTYIANEDNSFVDIGTEKCIECDYKVWLHGELLEQRSAVSDVGYYIAVIGYKYYDVVTDYEIDYNPDILNNYTKIIMMRNSYTTESFKELIMERNDVVYMFPDVFTKLVSTNMTSGMEHSNMTSIEIRYAGELEPLHESSLVWADDNRCKDWKLVEVENGHMMNCVSDIAIINNNEMIMAMDGR